MSDCVIAGITQTFNNAIDTQTVACRWGPSRRLDTGQTGQHTARLVLYVGDTGTVLAIVGSR